MNIILFGPPGSGKGTQSELLVNKEKMIQISTGDLLRAAIKSGSELGILAKSFMDKGELVPDKIVLDIVKNFLSTHSGKYILDGFPRSIDQARALDEIMLETSISFEKAFFLQVPVDTLIGRLTSRRVCKSCGSVYNIFTKMPKAAGICDNCSGEVIQRSDDSIEVVKNRLDVYEKYTSSLKDYYKEQDKLVVIDGSKPTEEVFENIKKNIIN